MDTTTTTTGGQAVQTGLADIFVLVIQLFFNLIVLSFRVVWTDLFSGLASLFQTTTM